MKLHSTHFLVIMLILAVISSCSTAGSSGNFDFSVSSSDPDNVNSVQPGLTGWSGKPLASKLVLFEGSVFVASTNPESQRWESAGWRIAKKTNSLDENQVPQDCTLYPHKGVENQWIGSCPGPAYIPSDGATHIAVMHTQLDGSTSLVQVAPAGD